MNNKFKVLSIIAVLALACIIIPIISTVTVSDIIDQDVPLSSLPQIEDSGMRGMWVTSVLNLDYPSEKGMNAAALMSYADNIIDNCSIMGINNIFLQVRPCSDALYDSDIFPWSSYLTGTQGTAPESGFDPLSYWVQKAHEKNLKIHAWINPYRITKLPDEYAALSSDNPAVLHPEWAVAYESNYYYDPAIPEVRQLVINGALEIVDKYDVDGIHLDDYFYPGADFDDGDSFLMYNDEVYDDMGDWRRNNVNMLIEGLDTALHNADPDIEFGVSCIGIWANDTTKKSGSATAGYESYSAVYADSKRWIKNGWVDYIAPQIFWNIGFEKADYNILTDWWADVVSGTDVKLYIGVADYKAGDTDPASAWYGTDEIDRQLNLNDEKKEISGEIHFRYSSVMSVPGLPGVLQSHYKKSSGEIVFNDLIGAEWAQSYIYDLTNKGIVSGYEDGTFRPLGNVKRSEYIKLVIEAFGINTAPVDFSTKLSDNPQISWFYDYMRTAEYYEILPAGMTDSYPEDYITRQDMAYFAHRAASVSGTALPSAADAASISFIDESSISFGCIDAVRSLAAAGVINGYEDKSYKPEGFATRAEASKIICTLLNYSPQS